MPRIFLQLTAGLTVLLTLLVGLSRAVAYDESYSQALRQFLLADPACSDLCFMGIHRDPHFDQIMHNLRTHDWVSTVSVDDTAQGNRHITWEWSGQQPGFIRTDKEGSLLIIYDGIVYPYVSSVSLYSSFSLGDLWLALGPPDTGFVWKQHFVNYAESGFLLRMDLSCRYFWQAAGVLFIGSRDELAPYNLQQSRQNVCHRERQ